MDPKIKLDRVEWLLKNTIENMFKNIDEEESKDVFLNIENPTHCHVRCL